MSTNQVFNGIKFYKRADNDYWYSTTEVNGKRVYMHKYVWEYYHDIIPRSYEVHHIDLNKDNNNIKNLRLMSNKAHQKLHSALNRKNPEWIKKQREKIKKAQEAAKAWHASPEGREWHKEHYEQMKEKLHQRKEMICENCGKIFVGLDNNHSRFCSNSCKTAWRKKSGIDDVIRQCVICGKEFKINKYSKTQTCGNTQCRVELMMRTRNDN